jgi:uncharacterized protein (DUF697 family)
MISLLVLCVVVGLIVWLLSLLPIPAPFSTIILVVGILIVVVAVLQTLFGFDLLNSTQGVFRR